MSTDCVFLSANDVNQIVENGDKNAIWKFCPKYVFSSTSKLDDVSIISILSRLNVNSSENEKTICEFINSTLGTVI